MKRSCDALIAFQLEWKHKKIIELNRPWWDGSSAPPLQQWKQPKNCPTGKLALAQSIKHTLNRHPHSTYTHQHYRRTATQTPHIAAQVLQTPINKTMAIFRLMNAHTKSRQRLREEYRCCIRNTQREGWKKWKKKEGRQTDRKRERERERGREGSPCRDGDWLVNAAVHDRVWHVESRRVALICAPSQDKKATHYIGQSDAILSASSWATPPPYTPPPTDAYCTHNKKRRKSAGKTPFGEGQSSCAASAEDQGQRHWLLGPRGSPWVPVGPCSSLRVGAILVVHVCLCVAGTHQFLPVFF